MNEKKETISLLNLKSNRTMAEQRVRAEVDENENEEIYTHIYMCTETILCV